MTGEDLRSREYQSLVTRLWPLIVSGKVQDRWARTFTYLCRAREDAQMPQRRSGLGRRDVMATGSRPLKRRRPGMAGTRQAEVGPVGIANEATQVLPSELEPVLKFLDVQTQSGRGGDRDRA